MKATVEILLSEYVSLLKKAMMHSMQEMEYTYHLDKIEKPRWKIWQTTKYTKRPYTDLMAYWNVVNSYYPWNQAFGVFAINRFRQETSGLLTCSKITITTELLAYTTMRAEKYKELSDE